MEMQSAIIIFVIFCSILLYLVVYLSRQSHQLKETISSLKIQHNQDESEKLSLIKHFEKETTVLKETLHEAKQQHEQTQNDFIERIKKSDKEKEHAVLSYQTKFNDLRNDLNSLLQQKNQAVESLKQAEKDLRDAQLSYLSMEKSIQKDYDALTETHPDTFTYIASLMADHLTLNIKKEEDFLSESKKYHERQRAVKIRDIRQETKELLTSYKESQYQLDYLIQIFPELESFIADSTPTNISIEEITANHEVYSSDPCSEYLSRSEWDTLSPSQRNQLALDRYLKKPKTNWQIGRDYELYIAHVYERKGYSVDTFGSYMRVNDLGRDLIAKKGDRIEIVQCKYWSTKKVIHENHICQLYGTVICYCIENHLSLDRVNPVFITSTILSHTAKEFARMLRIKVLEEIPLKDFPRIKCNIGHDEFGETKIYHLPIDALYDRVKISKKGECYCRTVAEAEQLGFRRAYRWHGNSF